MLRRQNKMKPIIGVMPLWDEERNSIWMIPGYMDAIIRAGGVPVILPLCKDETILEQLVETCDGFLFTGGQDVSPVLYDEKALEGVITSEIRDMMEGSILRKAIDQDKPVLGICRGIQFINIFLGGTLYQDIPSEHPSDVEHHQHPPYDVPIHEVEIVRGSPLEACINKDHLMVNSYHHQAIKKVAQGLNVMAVSADGLVEAVCMPEHKFLWAVQWHPELSYKVDSDSQKIFNVFVEAAI
jgi:putative glutamine amidotransferase